MKEILLATTHCLIPIIGNPEYHQSSSQGQGSDDERRSYLILLIVRLVKLNMYPLDLGELAP